MALLVSEDVHMKSGNYFGIDFGTTNTSVVQLFVDEQGTRKVNLGEQGEPFSSIVAIPKDGSKMKFGRDVRNRREELATDHDIFQSMKSYLGTDKEFIIGDNRYSATDITIEFLRSVKDYIQRSYHVKIDEAGFSFPVDFSPDARRELFFAAEKAGIKVKSFVSESTASFFANRNESQAYSRIMVLDWGGGTYDISILDIKKNSVSEATVFGERVGGDDIDLELARRVHADILRRVDNPNKISFEEMSPTSKDSMIARCEKAKIELTNTNDDYDFTIYNYGEYGTKSLNLSIDFFNGIVEPIIKDKILYAINAALGRAKLTPAGIDAVIIVGGSSQLTPYEQVITRLFGKEKIIIPEDPQWSTAEGAALMQLVGGNFQLNDTLGVQLSDGSIFPLFKAKEHGVGTKIDALSFSLVEDAQDAHFIFANSDNSVVFDKVAIPAKGFLNERIILTADIQNDQIARILIKNPFMGDNDDNEYTRVNINNLTFYYDTSFLR